MKSPHIPPGLLAPIRAQAEKEYPKECCGVLLGPQDRPDILTRAVACRNAQDDYHQADPAQFPGTSKTAFFLHPQELLAIHKECRAKRESIRVIYHSHIDAGSYFSAEDKLMAAPGGRPAYPGAFYLVLSVMEGKVKGEALFGWNPAKSDFDLFLPGF